MKQFLLVVLLGIFLGACQNDSEINAAYPMEVLVFTHTAGYKHESIPDAVEAVVQLGLDHGFVVDTTSDPSFFQIDSLSEYQVVVFLNTTGDFFLDEQKKAFEQYIQAGGGYVGVHAAADTEYGWEWYGKLVGAYFKSHPEIQTAQIYKAAITSPLIEFLPDSFTRKDEWYDFKSVNPDIQTILYLNQASYTGSSMDSTVHPIAWYHEFDGGRSFYTGLGHTKESYKDDSLFLKHLLKGILWAGKQPL